MIYQMAAPMSNFASYQITNVTNSNLAADAAEVDCRITSRVTSTNDHHSLVLVTIGVSTEQIHCNIFRRNYAKCCYILNKCEKTAVKQPFQCAVVHNLSS